jgi:hypothetical protein
VLLAAVGLPLERAGRVASAAVEELAGEVDGVLVGAAGLDTVLPQPASATAEPSASRTVGNAMVRDTMFLLDGYCRCDPPTAIDGAAAGSR